MSRKSLTIRNRRKRFIISQNTSDFSIILSRSMSINPSSMIEEVSIVLRRHSCNESEAIIITSEDVTSGKATFFSTSEFFSNNDKFTAGMYIGEVFVDGCHLEDIEIIKAPMHFISEVKTSDRCHGNGVWVEPDICGDENICNGLNGCGDPCDDMKEVLISEHKLIEGYADSSEDEPPLH